MTRPRPGHISDTLETTVLGLLAARGADQASSALIGRRDRSCLGKNPNTWFPDSDDRLAHNDALRICDKCPARAECIAFAVTRGIHIEHGVTGADLQSLRRVRRRALKEDLVPTAAKPDTSADISRVTAAVNRSSIPIPTARLAEAAGIPVSRTRTATAQLAEEGRITLVASRGWQPIRQVVHA